VEALHQQFPVLQLGAKLAGAYQGGDVNSTVAAESGAQDLEDKDVNWTSTQPNSLVDGLEWARPKQPAGVRSVSS
jgi:hypothetical protein